MGLLSRHDQNPKTDLSAHLNYSQKPNSNPSAYLNSAQKPNPEPNLSAYLYSAKQINPSPSTCLNSGQKLNPNPNLNAHLNSGQNLDFDLDPNPNINAYVNSPQELNFTNHRFNTNSNPVPNLNTYLSSSQTLNPNPNPNTHFMEEDILGDLMNPDGLAVEQMRYPWPNSTYNKQETVANNTEAETPLYNSLTSFSPPLYYGELAPSFAYQSPPIVFANTIFSMDSPQNATHGFTTAMLSRPSFDPESQCSIRKGIKKYSDGNDEENLAMEASDSRNAQNFTGTDTDTDENMGLIPCLDLQFQQIKNINQSIRKDSSSTSSPSSPPPPPPPSSSSSSSPPPSSPSPSPSQLLLPSLSSSSLSSIHRINVALHNFLRHCKNEILIQVWVPRKDGTRTILTTQDQPFLLQQYVDTSLSKYRTLSTKYTFSADSIGFLGLPGRVFLKKIPEWTPNVQFYKRSEYLRVNDAEQCNVRGSLALPVLESASGDCIGVIELVTLMERVEYRAEMESMCKVLEVVYVIVHTHRVLNSIKTPCFFFIS